MRRGIQWGMVVRDITGGEGVDLVVETMGPETIEQSIIASARYADIILLIWKSATRPALVIPGDVYGPKLVSIRRLFVGSRADLEAMIRAIAAHGMRPVVDRSFSFDRLREAYGYFDERTHFGKVVVLTS